MKKALFGAALGIFSLMIIACSHNYYRTSGEPEQIKRAKRVAIVSFVGNTVIPGNLAAAAASGTAKAAGEGLNEDYYSKNYDLYARSLREAGYQVIPVPSIMKSTVYQSLPAAMMIPTTINAKGLKHVSLENPDHARKLAQELKADYLLYITAGHSLGNATNWLSWLGIGDADYGLSSGNILIYDPTGKRVGQINVQEQSDETASRISGVHNPSEFMPLFHQAAKNVGRKLASELKAKAE